MESQNLSCHFQKMHGNLNLDYITSLQIFTNLKEKLII